jgi:hypothetical protein
VLNEGRERLDVLKTYGAKEGTSVSPVPGIVEQADKEVGDEDAHP